MSPPDVCPSCGAAFNLRDELRGRTVRCARCQQTFVAGATAVRAAEPLPAPDRPAQALPDPADPIPEAVLVGPARPALRRPLVRKKPRVLLITAIVLLSVCGGCATLGGLGYLFFIHGTEEPVTDADRAVLVTADDLVPFVEGFTPRAEYAKTKKVRHLDGSKELSYEYETPDGVTPAVYVTCEVTAEPSVSDAQGSYTGINAGLKLGLTAGGAQPVERNDLFRWGDQSRCQLLMNGGTAVGNVFTARKGTKVFHVIIVGFCFDKAKPLHDFLTPRLQKLDQYKP